MEPDRPNMIELPTVSVNPEAARDTYDLVRFFIDGSGGISDFLATAWSIYSAIAFILSALFIYGIIYSYLKINEYGGKITERINLEEERWRQQHNQNADQGNRRWQEVEAHVHSNNPNDWKLAIIEADVMLEKILEEKGYAGTTIADRLRSATGRSFQSIDDAWQAHRIRNQIAHGGTDFVLTQRMAQATIIQYKKVFEEFGMI